MSPLCSRRLIGPGSGHRGGLCLNAVHEVVPSVDERFGALLLQLSGQSARVHAGVGEFLQDLVGVTAVGREGFADLAMVIKCLQGFAGYRVDGKGGGQPLDVQRVRGQRVLCARAGPQQPLHAAATVLYPLERGQSS